MTNNQINCFIAVVNEKSYTRAANTMYISQPAISKSVSKLEEELGFELFQTVDKQLVLTEAGQMFYNFVIKAAEDFRNTISEIQEMMNKPLSEVRIGCPDTWNPEYFYRQITDYYSENHPDLKLNFEGYRLSELLNRLESRKLDVVLTHNFYTPPNSHIASINLTKTKCGILCSPEVYKTVKTPADFKDYEFLIFDERIDKRFGNILAEVCTKYNFEPKMRYVNNISVALFDIARNKGVMLFSDWDGAVTNSTYKYYKLEYEIPLNMLYNPDEMSYETQIFIDETKNIIF